MENMFDDIANDLSRIGIDIEMPIVHAIFVQDHSGSMDIKTKSGQTRAQLATNNFNEQLAKIKRESGDVITTVTIVDFDDRIIINDHLINEIRHDKNIQVTFPVDEVKPMTNWWTGGATSLRDAIGAAYQIGSVLLSEHDVDDQSVLVMILTDGEENASVEWSDKDIRDKIKELEDSGNWTFTFMGGQLQTSDMIANMGFSRGNTYSMSQTTTSYSSATKMSSDGIDKYYTMRKAGVKGTKDFFTEDDKWQQNKGENT